MARESLSVGDLLDTLEKCLDSGEITRDTQVFLSSSEEGNDFNGLQTIEVQKEKHLLDDSSSEEMVVSLWP